MESHKDKASLPTSTLLIHSDGITSYPFIAPIIEPEICNLAQLSPPLSISSNTAFLKSSPLLIRF